jgi:crotonobetainyl-CoA:carnitine CoA-transferase CaiB-like acyl-CoA transferase
MDSLFGDLKVLDITTGIAGPMATMMLADRGADVIRIETPEAHPFPALDGGKVWHRGKRSAEFDLTDPLDKELVLALAANADILVESAAPGRMDSLGLGFEALSAINPRLIYCSITGYGRNSRHSNRPAYDQLVAARTGLQWEARGWYGDSNERVKGLDKTSMERLVPDSIRIGSDRDGPIFSATPATSTITTYHAVLGISAALRARDLTGRGQWVEVSMLQAVFGMCGWQRTANDDPPGYHIPSGERRQTWGLVRAKDGFMCMWVSPPTWFTAAGQGDKIVQPAAGSVNRAIRMSIEDRLDRLEEAAPVIRKFTVDEWVQAAAEDGNIPCQPVRTPEQALCDPALLKDTAVVEVNDAELGVLRQAGAVYRLHDRPISIRWGAPRRGQHTDEVRAEAAALKPTPGPAHATPGGKPAKGPLEGVRVIDFGAAVAGPWATQLLAEMGADVIKVDPARQVGWMGTSMSHRVNRSKRWMGLDAKTAEGAQIARKLVEGADVVMLNLRPQAAKKLGLDYETLSQINPRLVYCHTRGFEDGPRSSLPGNDQTGNSLGGTTWEDGGCWNGGRPWFGTTSNGDLGNGYLASIGVVQALYDRERTGRGQKVDASIVNASLFNNSRVYTDRKGATFDRPTLDAGQTGLSALYRIYKCADEWICLAAFSEPEWRSLTVAIPALAQDARFATAEDRAKNDAVLTEALRGVFPTGTAQAWFERLDAAGAPCEISEPRFSQKVFDDPEYIARKLVVRRVGNPEVGPVDLIGRLIDFSDTPTEPGGAPPVMWQHTREILRELGYGDAEIDKLGEAGAIVLPQRAAEVVRSELAHAHHPGSS